VNRLSLIGIAGGLGLAVAAAAWLWRADHPADSGQAIQLVLAACAGALAILALVADAAPLARASRPWLLLLPVAVFGFAAAVALIQGVWLAAITPALVAVMFGIFSKRAKGANTAQLNA
jgi:hypothetical protein